MSELRVTYEGNKVTIALVKNIGQLLAANINISIAFRFK